MDVFNGQYYKLNKRFLCYHGLWVSQTNFKKRLAQTSSLISHLITTWLQFSYLRAVWGKDLDNTLECIPTLNQTLICLFQLCVFSISNKKLQILIECIKNDWKVWSSGVELEILRNYAKRGRGYTIFYAGYIFTSVSTFTVTSLTPIVLDFILPLNETRPKQLVYPAIYPFDHEKYINWILIHSTFTCFYHLSVAFATESMHAVATQHACGLYAIIGYRLMNTLKSIESGKIDSEEKEEKKKIYEELSFTIQCHNHAMKYCASLENLFSPFLFFTVGGNMLTMSVLLIQTLNSLDSMPRTMKYGSFATAIIFQVFVMSIICQNLLDHSLELVNEVYKQFWYEIPLKAKKLLTLIILQSSRPCKLTAGKVATIDMVTFTKILKTSVSYFTVLSSIRQTSDY